MEKEDLILKKLDSIENRLCMVESRMDTAENSERSLIKKFDILENRVRSDTDMLAQLITLFGDFKVETNNHFNNLDDRFDRMDLRILANEHKFEHLKDNCRALSAKL